MLSDKDIKEVITKIMNGEITKIKYANEIGMDPRTLYNLFLEWGLKNPENQELYLEYIKKYPCKFKVQDDVFKRVVEEMIEKKIPKYKVAEFLGITTRAFSKKILKLEVTDPILYEAYKAHAKEMQARGGRDEKLTSSTVSSKNPSNPTAIFRKKQKYELNVKQNNLKESGGTENGRVFANDATLPEDKGRI